MPNAIIPPVQPVAISAIPCHTPTPDKIPSTIIARNIWGLSFPIIFSTSYIFRDKDYLISDLRTSDFPNDPEPLFF